jgi:hypothetical protein
MEEAMAIFAGRSRLGGEARAVGSATLIAAAEVKDQVTGGLGVIEPPRAAA